LTEHKTDTLVKKTNAKIK